MKNYPICTGAVDTAGITHDGPTCPVHEVPNAHAVYAVLDTIHGPHPVRLSEYLSYGEAVDRHEALYGRSAHYPYGYARPVCDPGYTVYGRRVRWFAVRSVTDPNWPACGPVLPLKDEGAIQ
jgi:hypothetical protein